MSATTAIDDAEDMIAHLLCADATIESSKFLSYEADNKRGLKHQALDAGSLLRFDPMKPRSCYTVQRNADRLYAGEFGLLLEPAQGIIGSENEFSVICDDRVKWSGFRAIKKAPARTWIAQPGASLYEFHYREFFASGFSTYHVRLAALDKRGRPVATCIVGSRGSGGINEGELLVMAASVIEDAHRPGTLLSKVSDSIAISFPVPTGEHKELFSLRDAPLTSAGRRKAIIHWVAKHTRRTATATTGVSAHWRGVRELSVDGMTVQLSPNPEVSHGVKL